MSHLRMLATTLIPQAGHSANILRESKRYVELWHRRRRDIQSPYQIHNCLPQGIIERTEKERSLEVSRNKTMSWMRERFISRELSS